MEYSRNVKTTHYLTLDDDDAKNMLDLIKLAQEQINLLPAGMFELQQWMDELRSNLRRRGE